VKPAGAGHGNVANEPGTRGIALVDMFRIQDGMIAEHWDILQDVPETTANGNDMFSTVSEPRTSEPGPRMAGTSWPLFGDIPPDQLATYTEVLDLVMTRFRELGASSAR
jgi:hypothetical protein